MRAPTSAAPCAWGAQECRLKAGTLARELYGQDVVRERHRHRYEFNNRYRQKLEDLGLVISGKSMDDLLVEMIELANHPWFIACQAHPEFTLDAARRASPVHRLHPRRTRIQGRARGTRGGRRGDGSIWSHRVKLCHFEAGLDKPLFLIAGPCVIESMQLQLDTAGTLKEITGKLGIPFIFKSSFDKANRTSGTSFRGPRPGSGFEGSGRSQTPDRRAGAHRRARIHADGRSGQRG
jgi:hypothetical protein